MDLKTNPGQHIPATATDLRLGKVSKIPEGAVRIDDNDVLKLQARAVSKWQPQSEMWPLKYGPYVHAALGAVTGTILNNNFRNLLYLMTLGRGSTFLPSVILPSLASIAVHDDLIVKPLMLGKFECPVCMEVRSASLQVITGFVYPMIVTPLATVVIAKRHNTFEVPPFNDIRKIGRFYMKCIQPQRNLVIGLLALQLLGSFAVAQMEGMSFAKLMGGRLYEDSAVNTMSDSALEMDGK